MAKSPAVVLRERWVTQGIIGEDASVAWFGSVSKMPDGPDDCIAIFDYAGGNPYPHLAVDNPSVQVLVRAGANNYSGGYDKCFEIKDRTLGLMSQDLEGERWVSITMVGDINFLRRDDQDRPEWTLNFSVLKETTVTNDAERVAL